MGRKHLFEGPYRKAYPDWEQNRHACMRNLRIEKVEKDLTLYM